MIPFLTSGDDSNPESPIQKIILGALGKLTIFDAAPTQENNSLPDGEGGFFGTKVYLKLNGILYEFTVTQTA